VCVCCECIDFVLRVHDTRGGVHHVDAPGVKRGALPSDVVPGLGAVAAQQEVQFSLG